MSFLQVRDLTVAYDFSDTVHYYATYARSYKSGGINLSGLPLDANILTMTIMATAMPLVGRG